MGAYERRTSYIDVVRPRAAQVAPSLEWAGARATVRYQGDWRRREQHRYISLPFYGTLTGLGDLRLDRSLFTGDPDVGLTKNTGAQNTLSVERALGAR